MHIIIIVIRVCAAHDMRTMLYSFSITVYAARLTFYTPRFPDFSVHDITNAYRLSMIKTLHRIDETHIIISTTIHGLKRKKYH